MIGTFRRTVAAFSFVALVTVIAAAPSNAADAPTGVGSTSGSTHLVSVELNPLLTAIVGAESNGTSIDPSIGTPNAFQNITALGSQSSVPALNLLVGNVNTNTTGAQSQKTTNAVSLDSATLGLPGVLGGTVEPATLKSLVDANGAASSLNGSLTDVQALAGLARLHSANLSLSGLAAPTSSTAGRNATVDALTALNLGDLLQMLNINIGELSTLTLVKLVEGLGLIDDLNSSDVNLFYFFFDGTEAALPGAIKAVTDAQHALDNATAAVTACQADVTCLLATLTNLQSVAAQAQSVLSTATSSLGDLQSFLGFLLSIADSFRDQAIEGLSTMPLVSVQGVAAGATAVAKDTVGNSAATVTGSIQSITIGSLAPVGPVDATSALSQIQAASATVNGELGSVLSLIAPSLAGLVHLDLFPTNTNVFTENGYVKSVANITALVLTLTPPDLCTVFNELDAPPFEFPIDLNSASVQQAEQSGLNPNSLSEVQPQIQPNTIVLPEPLDITGVLAGLGSVVPSCPQINPKVANLNVQPAVAQGFTALSTPATFRIASINSAAEFKTVAAPVTTTTTPGDALPRTGVNETLFLVFGGLMAAAALGIRRVTQPVNVRASRKY